MPARALEVLHAASGARLVERFGVRVPARYGGIEEEYRAIHRGAAVVDLSWFGTIELVGPDRVTFLHNLTTNDLRHLGEEGGAHVCFLTVHGKMVAEGIALGLADRLLVLIDGGRAAIALVHTCLVEHNNVYWGVWHDMRQRSR